MISGVEFPSIAFGQQVPLRADSDGLDVQTEPASPRCHLVPVAETFRATDNHDEFAPWL